MSSAVSGRPVNAARTRNSSIVGGALASVMSLPSGEDHASDMPPHSPCRRKSWLGACMTSVRAPARGRPTVEHRMFKRLSIAAMGLGLVAATAMPAFSQGTLRIGMTAADIPLTTGQPDQGFEGFRFAGYTIYD